ncbi:SMC-Scp complex subunit ScpB [Candidatus Woesearchaeota archaeon]|nr:SMC-Scp complex subunit ScpB [Candidatus Woesearchaeota archaeon]
MSENTDSLELKNRVEAILFASGDKVLIEDIRKYVKSRDLDEVKVALDELKSEYDNRDCPLKIINENSFWKITVREKYVATVRRIVPRTELPKTIIETLALIAWKNPAKQSDIVAMRTNKAYAHINELLDTGFITRIKKGRTYLLKLTERFFDYFDVEGNQNMKQVFDQMRTNLKQRKKASALDNTLSIKIPISSEHIHIE